MDQRVAHPDGRLHWDQKELESRREYGSQGAIEAGDISGRNVLSHWGCTGDLWTTTLQLPQSEMQNGILSGLMMGRRKELPSNTRKDRTCIGSGDAIGSSWSYLWQKAEPKDQKCPQMKIYISQRVSSTRFEYTWLTGWPRHTIRANLLVWSNRLTLVAACFTE
ncbi:hypothetical protein Z517_09930 [Fonsecaea pedrosoi CBS 271.37]|uniref:Uncharacterized protein n=1 Tax=Fonsecaea pedrosoi CBS 271.37 TaxID=1442368 RepID=A0A0D2GYP2_9EURO|nr:uncharacterized protein Z517_09930 [Fonsecaea pedrosoi CBS 271.37]KIW77484.1 hypothetical protein Z517_09930 [Fonsecaea pedrosoi CBS 271.37]